MAAPVTVATAEGSLYELVARGNKDVFFFQDTPKSKFPFDPSYEVQAATISEIRRVPPRNAPDFGRTVEFDLDLVGDIMRSPTLVINLPSWLPPTIARQAQSSLITDEGGASYGYVNNIAYFLFEQIQFYQDNILLQEFSGDGLWAAHKATGTYGHCFVYNTLTGQHDGSTVAISRQAAPPQLRLDLPLVGCQSAGDKGFPQRSATKHSYRLRCKLRRLEDLVESSDLSNFSKPAPWSIKTLYQRTSPATPNQQGIEGTVPFTPIPRQDIAPITLLLETTQVYVQRHIQDLLEREPQQLFFKRLFENKFTQNQLDYQGIMGAAGGSALITRRLDGRHPTGRILFFFRTQKDIQANRLWKLFEGFTTVTLVIAGQTREYPRGPLAWRDIVNFGKEQLDTESELCSMNWTMGHIPKQRFPESLESQPSGTINMSTADRPTFNLSLTQPPLDFPVTELRVITEGWARFDTDGQGRAELFSAN
jgi:hypothetical protein